MPLDLNKNGSVDDLPWTTDIQQSLSSSTFEVSSNLFSDIPRRPIYRKPVCRGTYECSRLCKVNELTLNDPMIAKIPRCGVVYYTVQDKKVYFCFGRDKNSKDLTDFGGGRRTIETPIQCAVREGNEEARFAFGEITTDDVQNFSCMYNKQMLIIFVPVNSTESNVFEQSMSNFESLHLMPKQYYRHANGAIVISKCCDEISEMVWLDESHIDDIMADYSQIKIYTRVRRFIRSCLQFHQSGQCLRDWFRQVDFTLDQTVPVVSNL